MTRITRLGEITSVLEWDQMVLMPSGGQDARVEQLALLAEWHHKMLTDQHLAEVLSQAEDEESLDSWQRANVREIRRAHQRAVAVPVDLITARTKAAGLCEHAWREARQAQDFALVQPSLTTVLALTREMGQALGASLGMDPYDALIDGFDPGFAQADIDPLLDDYAAFLPGLLERVKRHQSRFSPPVVHSEPVSVSAQETLSRHLMTDLGFDFTRGRLDVSLHPFCGGIPDDVRLTTRYNTARPLSALMGVLHETGHALYEMGLPAKYRNQLVGRARGMALHESQSLMIEMQVARGSPYLAYMAPLLAKHFGGQADVWRHQNLMRLTRHVEPGFVRVDADEVTYPAHIILRYRLEKAFMRQELEVSDIPSAWSAGMKELLGLHVENDSQGCLQDIHWHMGEIGYFPSYALGAFTAAQLYDAAQAHIPDLESQLATGNVKPLLVWLGNHVHGRGSSMSSQQILCEATGRKLEIEPFKAHLERRYIGDA